jgi:hypothetical protein
MTKKEIENFMTSLGGWQSCQLVEDRIGGKQKKNTYWWKKYNIDEYSFFVFVLREGDDIRVGFMEATIECFSGFSPHTLDYRGVWTTFDEEDEKGFCEFIVKEPTITHYQPKVVIKSLSWGFNTIEDVKHSVREIFNYSEDNFKCFNSLYIEVEINNEQL